MKPFLMLAFYFSPEQYESEKKKKRKGKAAEEAQMAPQQVASDRATHH